MSSMHHAVSVLAVLPGLMHGLRGRYRKAHVRTALWRRIDRDAGDVAPSALKVLAGDWRVGASAEEVGIQVYWSRGDGDNVRARPWGC